MILLPHFRLFDRNPPRSESNLSFLIEIHPGSERNLSFLIKIHPGSERNLSFLIKIHPRSERNLSFLIEIHPGSENNLSFLMKIHLGSENNLSFLMKIHLGSDTTFIRREDAPSVLNLISAFFRNFKARNRARIDLPNCPSDIPTKKKKAPSANPAKVALSSFCCQNSHYAKVKSFFALSSLQKPKSQRRLSSRTWRKDSKIHQSRNIHIFFTSCIIYRSCSLPIGFSSLISLS